MLASCSAYQAGQNSDAESSSKQAVAGNFALDEQVAPPPNIQSLELNPEGQKGAPPIIQLGKSALTLEFDHLDSGAHTFRLKISHRSKNWQESPIPPHEYLEGFFDVTFSGGSQSFAQNPTYFHYSYRFPNERMQITKSGNYLLSVFDYQTDELLFRIPFFVTENAGKLQTRIEELYTQRSDGRTVAQPFSIYHYPEFVQQPQFDLSFFYVQNQFWGRAQGTDLFDTATPEEVHFHLDREKSFIADYEFNVLDLRSFDADGRQIVEVQPAKTPPIVTLRRDVQQFNNTTSRYPGPTSGIPRNDRQAQYGNVQFSLETARNTSPAEEIYLVGDFNNWVLDSQFRMRYDSTQQLWQGNALIKQGLYTYKYVQLEGNEVNDLALDQSFSKAKQEYLTFVYFRDPQRRFDRLLQVERIIEN